MSAAPERLFRQEALEHHGRSEVQGSLLKLTPIWARVAYWLVLVLCVTVGVGLAIVSIHDYAQGPVLIQVKGLEEVSATSGGRVSRILVKRGQQVRAGEPLVELYSGGETAELERANEEFRAQLAARLLDPQDGAARQSLASLRAQLDLSGARLSERTLKATVDGWVREIRVREGQHISVGDRVATLMKEGTESYALALVPGQYRPMLQQGQSMRLELQGFAYLYQDLEVTHVSDELLGPAEVKRYLGADLGDVVTLTGPVVAVEARLPHDTFRVQHYNYRFYNGMLGTARVRVRSRNGWSMLIPAIDLLRRDRG
ncbi:efflux RND transporter periplasmic adaptor subunit [Archangium violaceum]|uniref:RND transporter n=1 Tax=Archangium violaceum Cb vi76 TaxID=1406225 RepID=A0A084T1I9_9BACT|nr:efflux RND transporter periplasmic adaptor subunit [Archangium violaceum]KFA94574.1 RND transporter [Archangium violaceum Cb vi76]